MIRIFGAVALTLGVTLTAHAQPEINEARAKYHYQMFCQGCHTPDGTGGRGVPNLQGFMGHFLTTNKGRAYLVRVPGSANSTLNDEMLAELLNWQLTEFAGDSLPAEWEPYTATEVGLYRQDPLIEVSQYRKNLVTEILGEQ